MVTVMWRMKIIALCGSDSLKKSRCLIFWCALISFVVVGCGAKSRNGVNSDYEREAASFTTEDLQLVQQKSGLVLPAGSRGLNLVWRGRQMDPSFFAKIAIATNFAKAFQTQLGGFPDQKISINHSIPNNINWWQPFQGKIVLERTFMQAGCYLHLVLCDDGGNCILYMEWVSA